MKNNSLFDKIEEAVIAIILGCMTLLTFANVVARYVFNSNIFYALELTVFLLAWLVLLGSSYAVKKTLHMGIDYFVNLASRRNKRIIGLFVVSVCIVYSLLLLKGSWDYWAPYANLPPTEGRWFPTGFVDKYRELGWYETKDIPVPFFFRWLEDFFNYGEPYQKIPKLVPYFVLPVSMMLLGFRFVQAGIRVWRGEQELLIVSYEFENEAFEVAGKTEKT